MTRQAAPDDRSTRPLGLGTCLGLVVANMVGVGVLTTTGFMARDLGPAGIILAWFTGGLVAAAGARAYSALARAVPRSGGEYRYLAELMHPALGHLAGTTSLLVGFSAPIAVAAHAAGAFATTLVPGANALLVATSFIMFVTLFHAFDLRVSTSAQNALVLVKGVLLGGFVLVGLATGPWRPASFDLGAGSGFPWSAFFVSLIYVGYSYSGWNAVTYATEEVRDPDLDVPRAMLGGVVLVGLLYLATNWVFVSNLSGERLRAWTATDTATITLGHLVMDALVGPTGARAMSLMVLIALVSSISAMTFAGPRVYSAMARDGFLPGALEGRDGRPPTGSVLFQGGLAVLMLVTNSFDGLIRNVGCLLTLISSLAVLSLFRVRFGGTPHPRPDSGSLLAAGFYLVFSFFALAFTIPSALHWVLCVVVVSLGAYRLYRRPARE